jgi:hypothetical protein
VGVAALIFLLGCARPATFWIGGDVFVASDRPILAPELAAHLHGPGIVNLEGPVGDPPGATSDGTRTTLLADPAALPALRDAGIRFAGLANNHRDDAGPEGPARTAAALAALGIESSDAGTFEVDGQKVVLIHVIADPGPPSEALRADVDAAIASGADVVAVSGTHAFAGVERRGGTIIAWGLGNLAFDCACTSGRDALLLQVQIGGPATVIPIRAGLRGEAARMADDPDAFLDALSAMSPTELSRQSEMATF